MKIKYLSVFLFLLIRPAIGAASDSSAWMGVWRVTQETHTDPATFYLHLREGANNSLYSSSWQELPVSDWRIQGSNIHWNWLVQGMNLVFEGTRQGESLQGNWQLVHPQHRLSGKMTAEKVFEAQVWSPLGGVERARRGPVTNLADLLIQQSKAGLTDLSKAWEEHLFPEFYPFLQNAPPVPELFQTLQNSETASWAERVSQAVEAFDSGIKGLSIDSPIRSAVLLPWGKGELAGRRVGEHLFLTIEIKAAQGKSDRDLRNLITQRTAAEALPHPTGPHGRAFRSGLGPFLSSQMGFAQTDQELFGLSSEAVQEIRRRNVAQKKTLAAPEGLTSGSKEERILGFDFLQMLKRRFTVQQILEMQAATLSAEFQAFVNLLQ